MNEQDVRKIVNEMIDQKLYQLPKIPPHKHDGVDNIRILSSNIDFPNSVNGTITMSSITTYTLNLTGKGPSPRQITFLGGALNVGSGVHAFIVGSAQLGANQQFQPINANSVSTGPVVTTIIQGSASITDLGSSAFLKNSQGHIIYAEDPSGTIVAVGNVISYSNSSIQVQITELASGWSISGLWTVT